MCVLRSQSMEEAFTLRVEMRLKVTRTPWMPERTISRDGTSRVAIFRDREKGRSDPDYDRSNDRYFRGHMPNRNPNLGPFNLQSFPAPFIQYESSFPQLDQLPRTQTTASYRGPSNEIMSPFCAIGSNQTSRDGVYMQWATAAMIYAHTYEHSRHAHAIFQFCTYFVDGSIESRLAKPICICNKAKNLIGANLNVTSDPYAIITCGAQKRFS